MNENAPKSIWKSKTFWGGIAGAVGTLLLQLAAADVIPAGIATTVVNVIGALCAVFGVGFVTYGRTAATQTIGSARPGIRKIDVMAGLCLAALLVGPFAASQQGCTAAQLKRALESLKVTAEIVAGESAKAGLCAMSCGLWDDRRECYEGCVSVAVGDGKEAIVDELVGLAPDLIAAHKTGGLRIVAPRPVSLFAQPAPSVPDGCDRRQSSAYGITITKCVE